MTAAALVPFPYDRSRGDGWFARTRRSWAGRRADREYEQECWAFAEHLRFIWRDACEGVGASRTTDTATGPTVRTPKVGRIVVDRPTTMLVELLPGQEPQDLSRVGDRLAHSLGFETLRVVPHGGRLVRIELLDQDPLTEPHALPLITVQTCQDPGPAGPE